jgi:superfamily II RNA helicase
MVKICSEKYPSENEDLYKNHFEKFSFPLSDFQKHSIEAIVTGNHTLVTAHTGSGKTLPAEFAIQYFVEKGKRVVYTSPIKALSNQKYYEFTKKYPHIRFALFTGDIKTNPDADVLIMTTEILMNYLFTSLSTKNNEENVNNQENPRLNETNTLKPNLQFQIDINTELACVIFDEVHYINDQDRGQTWEKTILMLPEHVQIVMLSATIDNPEGFASWCERGSTEKQVYLSTTNHRVVPLYHYGFLTTTESIFKTIKDKAIQQQIRDSTNTLIPLKDSKGLFQWNEVNKINKMNNLFETYQLRINRKHVLNQLSLYLRDRDMLPAIAFVFSRKHVESCAQDITVPLLEFDSKVSYTVRYECEQIIRKLPNFREYLDLPEYNQLVTLLEKGIGIHHSGMIPILREIVELMISKKYIKLLFATESFAIGLDCPIRTAVFTSLKKFDGNGERYLYSHEYMQMAGRAGRRGIDTIGYVVHCNNLFQTPPNIEYSNILCGKPQKLVSKYHISYNLILNLLKNGQTNFNMFSDFSKKSMIYNEIEKDIDGQNQKIRELEERINKKIYAIQFSRTPKDVCQKYIELENNMKILVNKKRKDAERELSIIKEEFNNIINDSRSVQELLLIEQELNNLKGSVYYSENFISKQTELICDVMEKEGFIEKSENESLYISYNLTILGKIASNLAEIHPLILSKCMIEWDMFQEFTPKQLVGLFSCFTDVKVSEEYRYSKPHIDDLFLKSKIESVITMYEKYRDIEIDKELNTGINYENSINFDIIDYTIQWCDYDNEYNCKVFIQTHIIDKSISIGDFTKAMLKIVTITNEFINICEEIGEIELLYKLNQIERMVLKYVTTSQSLYI